MVRIIIPMAMGECSAYSSLQADSKIKFAAWPTSRRPPGTDHLSLRGPKVNSQIWLCAVANSTIKIVLCNIIIIIISQAEKGGRLILCYTRTANETCDLFPNATLSHYHLR